MSTLVDVGQQERAIAFRRTLQDARLGETISPSASWLDFYPHANALRSAAQKAELAFVGGADLHSDPTATQADKDAARLTYLEAHAKYVAQSEQAEAWRAANLEALSEELAAKRAEDVELVLAKLDDVESVLQEIALRDLAFSRMRNDHRAKRDAPVGSRQVRIAGEESLHNLRTGIASLLPLEPVELVSQAEYRRRRDAGEDTSRVRITHSPGGELWPVGRPSE